MNTNSKQYVAWMSEVWRLNDLRNKAIAENRPIVTAAQKS